jgi:hypothetical protein
MILFFETLCSNMWDPSSKPRCYFTPSALDASGHRRGTSTPNLTHLSRFTRISGASGSP